MNEKLANTLLILAKDPHALGSVQEELNELVQLNQLNQLVPQLKGWEEKLATRVIKAKELIDVFAICFQITPPNCFTEISDKIIIPIFVQYACLPFVQRTDDFYWNIDNISGRFQDKAWLPKILTALSPQDVENIFTNANETEVKQLFSYLKLYLRDDQKALKEFFGRLSHAAWLQLLNHLDEEDLTALNLAVLARESAALRQALADWLREMHLKSPPQTFWHFVEKQQLLWIPDVINLIAEDKSEVGSDFWLTFKKNASSDQDISFDFLMPKTLDEHAPFPIGKLSLYDQLLAYGLASVHLGQKQILLNNTANKNGPDSVEVSNAKNTRETYLQQSPFLRSLFQQTFFPLSLIPVLAKGLPWLSKEDIKKCLETAKCLPEPVLTIEEWVEEYGDGAGITSKGKLLIARQLTEAQIYTLAKTLKANNTIKKVTLTGCGINAKGCKILADIFKTNTTIHALRLSCNNINNEGATILANTLAFSTTLKKVDLHFNKIKSAGAIALAKVLKADMDIDLEKNPIDNEGIKAWMKALETNKAISKLDLPIINNPADDYNLCLMSALPRNRVPIEGNIYLEKQGNKLKYIVLTPDNKVVEGMLDFNVDVALTPYKLMHLKPQIIKEISKRGHIYDALKAISNLLEKNSHITTIKYECIDKTKKLVWRIAEILESGHPFEAISLNYVDDAGAQALALALKMNTSLVELDINGNYLTNVGAQAFADLLKTHTTLRFLNLTRPVSRKAGIKDKNILAEIHESLTRNKNYYNLHKEINKCLKQIPLVSHKPVPEPKKKNKYSISKKIEPLIYESKQISKDCWKQLKQLQKNNKSDVEKAEELLNTALEAAQELYNATPRYAHAEALLHEVKRQIAFTYARHGDYQAFIELYFNYFISHPDDVVSLELASLLTWLGDEQYASTGLNIKTDKQQLILSILTGNKEPQADVFRSQALQVLKGGESFSNAATFAEVARVADGIIITFAELVSLQDNADLFAELEENKISEQETLLQKIKTGKVKAYVYEQIIMKPQADPKPIEFKQAHTLNQDDFEGHAAKVTDKIPLLTRLIYDFYLVNDLEDLEKNEPSESHRFYVAKGADGLLHYSVIDPSGKPIINQIIQLDEIEESHRAAFAAALGNGDLCTSLKPFKLDILKIASQKSHTVNFEAPSKELKQLADQPAIASPEPESATNVLAELTSAIKQNYGEHLNEFSIWHSRTVTARRLANLDRGLTLDQLRVILEVEIKAKQRSGALNTQPKSRSFFPNIPEKTLVERFQEVVDTLPPAYTVNDRLTELKKEMAELLLDWVDQKERSLSYKIIHNPDDGVGQKIKKVGELAHQILLCPLSPRACESLDDFKNQNIAFDNLYALKTNLILLNIDAEANNTFITKFNELEAALGTEYSKNLFLL